MGASGWGRGLDGGWGWGGRGVVVGRAVFSVRPGGLALAQHGEEGAHAL